MAERKGAINTAAEFSQTIDKATAVVALGGLALGIIAPGAAFALLAVSGATYIGAEAVKQKK